MKKHFFFSSWRPTAAQDLLEVASPPNGTEKQSFKWNAPDLLVLAPPPDGDEKNNLKNVLVLKKAVPKMYKKQSQKCL